MTTILERSLTKFHAHREEEYATDAYFNLDSVQATISGGQLTYTFPKNITAPLNIKILKVWHNNPVGTYMIKIKFPGLYSYNDYYTSVTGGTTIAEAPTLVCYVCAIAGVEGMGDIVNEIPLFPRMEQNMDKLVLDVYDSSGTSWNFAAQPLRFMVRLQYLRK